ncbi:MAG: zinc-ribbon domain-containing protein [Bacillota bacterium]|nr:zinc-ribbon domain-containing protein [Bacillota bacterium]
MAYCGNCGSKIEEGDLFCENCGTRVTQAPNQNNETIGQDYQPVKSIKNTSNYAEIINILKNSALSPVTCGKQFVVKAAKNEVIIITLILTILQGILGIWRVNEIVSNLQNIVLNFLRNLSSLTSLFGQGSSSSFSSSDLDSMYKSIDQFKSLITIPYGKIFIQNCALNLIGIFVLFILIYLGINILTQVRCTPFILFKAVLVSTLPILICEIISILCSYFSLYLGVAFVALGFIISIATLTIIVRECLQIKENLCVLIVSISALISSIVLVIALHNFISSDLSQIITSTINSFKNSLFKY